MPVASALPVAAQSSCVLPLAALPLGCAALPLVCAGDAPASSTLRYLEGTDRETVSKVLRVGQLGSGSKKEQGKAEAALASVAAAHHMIAVGQIDSGPEPPDTSAAPWPWLQHNLEPEAATSVVAQLQRLRTPHELPGAARELASDGQAVTAKCWPV